MCSAVGFTVLRLTVGVLLALPLAMDLDASGTTAARGGSVDIVQNEALSE